MNLNNKKGLSLIELIIAVIIVGILSIVSVNIYRTLLMRAVSTEGKALAGMLIRAEKVYWVEYGTFYGKGLIGISSDSVLGIDIRANKYFRTFEIHDASTVGLWIQSKAPVPYDGLELVIKIENDMSQERDAKPIIQLYDMKHSSTTTIEIEL